MDKNIGKLYYQKNILMPPKLCLTKKSKLENN